jgi:signal recognition particle subunit SEC65
MFEQALRLKLRFPSPQGNLTVEDLWDLPLTSTRQNTANLNNIAKAVSRLLKAESEEDFVNPRSGANETLQLSLDIVKHIIAVRQAENEATRLRAERTEKKAKLLELIARKQDQALEGKPLEELQQMVASL